MVEIIVTIHVYVEKGDQMFQNKEVPLTLETLAAFTPDDAEPKSFGRWKCPSYYLGADMSGKYYVKNNNRFPDNPFGFFLDSQGKDDDPFLVLRGFKPMSMKTGAEGEGRILRTHATDVKYPDVKWRCSKA